MSLPLLQTKLYLPPPDVHSVHRARLIESLNQAVTHPITLLSAPAGFGKTTLIRTWIAQQALPVAWLSLDGDDNEPTCFLSYLIAALQSQRRNLGDAAQAMLATPQTPPLKTILTRLLNDLNTLDTPLLLVLDDYHLIIAQPIHEALAFLVDHLPANLRLILTSRSDPPLPLSRWRVRNQLSEIRSDALRFTSEEAENFLNQQSRLNLTSDQITTLATRTEGWIAGLQLASLSLGGDTDRNRFFASFTGANRLILDYLVEEVLNQQSEEVKHFLLHTAILDRLCAPLCDALLERAESQVILERLERANLFLLPLDQERHWYRYHHLFAEMLRHILRQQTTAPIIHLYQRASTWHEAAGLYGEAVRYARAVEDWERVAQIIERHALTLLGRGEAATLRQWLDALPVAEVRVRPYLNLVYAWVDVLAAHYDAVEEYLQRAEAALARPSCLISPSLSAAEIEGQIAAVRTLVAVHRHDPVRARQLGQAALQAIPEENRYVRAMLLYALGLAEWSSDNAAAARALFRQVSRLGDRSEQRIVTFSALTNLAGLQEVQGKLRLAAESYRQALALASEASGSPWPLAAMAYLGLGFLQREWHELAEAEANLRTGITLSQRAGFEVSEALGWFGLALTHQAQGDRSGLSTALTEAERIVARWGDAPPPVQVSIYQTRLAFLRQDWQAAARYCQEQPARAGHIPQEWREGDAIMRVRVLLAQDQAASALARLKQLLPVAEEADRGWHLLEILLLQALAWHKLDDLPAALSALERAIALAEPEGYIHLFVDDGVAITPLLRKVAARGMAVDYIGKLLSVLEASQPSLPTPPPGVEPLLEPLSERELEVLRLMAAGLQNQAIADELVVVLGTVKAHINHIYQKLGVSNRVQAMTRARALGLLS